MEKNIILFVNGQHTTQAVLIKGAFRAYVKTIKRAFSKDYDAIDIRSSIVAAVSVKVMEPVFEVSKQNETRLK